MEEQHFEGFPAGTVRHAEAVKTLGPAHLLIRSQVERRIGFRKVVGGPSVDALLVNRFTGDQPLDAALHGRHQARMREGVQRCRGGRCERHIPAIRGTDHAHAVGIRLEAAAELRRAESFGGIERDALGTGPECVVHFLKDSFGRSAKFRIQPAEKRGTRILVALVHDSRVIGELRIMRIKVRIDHREHIVEIPVVKTLVNHELGDLFRREGGCHHLLAAGMGFVRHLVGHLRDHVAAEAAPDGIA